MSKNIKGVLAGFLLLVAVVSAGTAFTSTVATKADVREVSERHDRDELKRDRRDIQNRVWDMEDRWTDRFWKEYGRGWESKDELVAFMDDEDRATYRDLLEQLREIDETLNPEKKKSDT